MSAESAAARVAYRLRTPAVARFLILLPKFAAVGAALLFASCTLNSPRDTPPALMEDGFELSGRFAMRLRDEGASGRIEWRHDRHSDELAVNSPLGQGIARITRNGREYRLHTARDEEFRATDPESLTEKALGWRLPLAGLPDWVRARPSPGAAVRLERNAAGRLIVLEQDDWRVEYQDYEPGESGLPTRVQLTRGELQIRLLIERWGANGERAP